LRAKFVYQLNDGPEQFEMRELGEIPVMVKVSLKFKPVLIE